MSNKVAIVLGGTAGVGHAIVRALLNRGYDVGIVARGQARLDAMKSAHGARVATMSADVGDAEALATALGIIVNELGRPTVWVNSAMLTTFSPFREMTAEEFEKIVNTTFMGQVNGTRLALRYMKRGNIVCVGSGLAYRPVPYQSAYCAAKHAINGFVGSIRSELIRDRSELRISLVQLPALNTPQFDWARNRLSHKPQPAPPIFAPTVAADAVMKAIDEDVREIFVGGSVLKLVLPNFVLPNWLDHKLAKSGAEMQKSDRTEPGDRPDNLMEPIDYPATSTGSFGDRAQATAYTVDADSIRKTVAGSLIGAAALIGLIVGLLLG